MSENIMFKEWWAVQSRCIFKKGVKRSFMAPRDKIYRGLNLQTVVLSVKHLLLGLQFLRLWKTSSSFKKHYISFGMTFLALTINVKHFCHGCKYVIFCSASSHHIRDGLFSFLSRGTTGAIDCVRCIDEVSESGGYYIFLWISEVKLRLNLHVQSHDMGLYGTLSMSVQSSQKHRNFWGYHKL